MASELSSATSPSLRLGALRSHPPLGTGTPSRLMFWAALLTVYIVWGSTYLAIRVALRTLPPFALGSVRFLIAGSLLFLWAAPRGDRKADPLGPSQWRATALVGAALLFVGNGGVILALQRINSGTIALLIATTPFWTLVIGRFWLEESVRPRDWLGLLVGFAGVSILVRGGAKATAVDPIGAALGLFSAASWALGSVYARRAPLPRRSLVATSMEMLAGGVLLGIASIATGEPAHVDLSAVSGESLAAFIYLVIFGSLLGFTAYAWLIRVARLSVLSSYAYVNPAVALLLGFFILDEALTSRTFVAASLILGSVALMVVKRSPKKASATRSIASD